MTQPFWASVSMFAETRITWPNSYCCYKTTGDYRDLPLCSMSITFPSVQKRVQSLPFLSEADASSIPFSQSVFYSSLVLMPIFWLLGILLEGFPVRTPLYNVEFAFWWKQPGAWLCPWQITDPPGFAAGNVFARQMSTALSCREALC